MGSEMCIRDSSTGVISPILLITGNLVSVASLLVGVVIVLGMKALAVLC